MRCAAVIIALLPVAPMAQGVTALEPHAHGTGQMAISFSENGFSLTLEAPGIDIVGFEHSAGNEGERTGVADAISDLSKPLEIFEVPPEAGCVTATANVALVGDVFAQVEGRAGDNAAHHTEFQAEYLIQCEEPSLVTSIQFTYFERFAGAERLLVELTSADGTQNIAVERAMPILKVPG